MKETANIFRESAVQTHQMVNRGNEFKYNLCNISLAAPWSYVILNLFFLLLPWLANSTAAVAKSEYCRIYDCTEQVTKLPNKGLHSLASHIYNLGSW